LKKKIANHSLACIFIYLQNYLEEYQRQQSSFAHWLFIVKLPNYFISFLNK